MNPGAAMGATSALESAKLNQTDILSTGKYALFAIAGGFIWGIALNGGSTPPQAVPTAIGAVSHQVIGSGGGGAFPSNLIVINPQLLFVVSNGIAYLVGTEIISFTIADGGTGYAMGDTGTIAQGVGAIYTVNTVGGGGAAATITISPRGAGYVVGSTVATAAGGAQPGAGSGMTLTITAVNWDGATVEIPNGVDYFVTSATYIDQYIVCTVGTSQDPLRRQFFVSDVGNPAVFNPLEYGTKESLPDPNVCVFAANELLMVMGATSIELWEDTGAVNFPFQRITGGGVIEIGLVEFGNTVAKVGDGTVCFIGTDERGANIAWQMAGRTPQRISTNAIEAQWYVYDTTGANAYVAQHEGHWFYVVNFPIVDKTWAYDISTGQWAQWCLGNWQDTSSVGDLARYHAAVPGIGHVVLDKNGNTYLQLLGLNADDTTPIRSIRRSPIVDAEMRREAVGAAEGHERRVGLHPQHGRRPPAAGVPHAHVCALEQVGRPQRVLEARVELAQQDRQRCSRVLAFGLGVQAFF